MTQKRIIIGKDFARVPGGRFREFGDFSGEMFREDFLVPALKENDRVEVYLDGAQTYMSSFLEEAFGGLIRKQHFTYEDLKNRLTVTAEADRYKIYVRMVEQDMLEAANTPPGERSPQVA